jgi:hypothetical protein
VAEFLRSLDVVDGLDARLCLSGHGRPFVDVGGHIEGNRKLVRRRLELVMAALNGEPRTALEITPSVHEEPLGEHNAGRLLAETLCYLHHLELQGAAVKEAQGDSDQWRRQ